MTQRTKKIVISLLLIICIAAAFLTWPKKAIAKPTNDRATFTSEIIGGLSVSQGTKQTLLKTYCAALTKASIQDGLVEGGMYFTPKYSLFVAALCDPFAKENKALQPFNGGGKDSLLKKNFSRERLGVIASCGEEGGVCDVCDPSGSMEDCDLSILLPKIFSRVMDDHSILSIAGWTFGLGQGETSNEAIRNGFSTKYFGNIGNVCGDKNNSYLGTKSASSSKNALCAHPKTASYLDAYINKLRKQQNKIQTLEVSALQQQVNENACKTTENGIQASLLLCSYSNKGPIEVGPSQTNLRYNELLFYKTLVAWLSMKLDDPNFKPVYIGQSQILTNTTAGGNNERLNLQREITLSQKSMILMKKNIYNFRSTFPLHIGLLAYYEDILTLRKSMAKMYTPIHQLYYKLRNVQAK